MDLAIEDAVLDWLHGEARSAAPFECCGLLLSRDGIIDAILPARNVSCEPERHFEIDPQTLIDAHRAARGGGPAIAGYYHSHPAGPARPSSVDRVMAAGDGMVWAIVGRDEITFWRDAASGFVPLRTA